MARRPHDNRHGFSLIELMVVIGIIALIIAIALPALGGARKSAKQLQALSNIAQTHTLFEQYAADNGRYPFRAAGDQPAGLDDPVEPNALTFRWWPDGHVVIATTDHFGQEALWPAIVAPFEDWPTLAEIWMSPGKDTHLPTLDELQAGGDFDLDNLFSIVYSNSFVARPNLWTPDRGETVDRLAELRPTNPAEVRSPAAKVMLWDKDLAYITDEIKVVDGHKKAPTPMAFADGHADVKDPTEATEGVPNPLREGNTMKLHNTREGVYGVDYN
ncbi:MAG: prepilin-type N-terminal cleavage/methylation domain-containing protein [Phycisphaerales bacterium]